MNTKKQSEQFLLRRLRHEGNRFVRRLMILEVVHTQGDSTDFKDKRGDPLEIFTDKEGEVILKKYSPIGELGDFAAQYAESIHKTSGYMTCIADRDTIIAVAGASRKEFLDKSLSPEVEKIIEEKATFVAKSSEDKSISILADEGSERKYVAQVVSPIIAEGDPIGAVMILSTEPGTRMGEVEAKLAQSAAGFLGKQMEQ